MTRKKIAVSIIVMAVILLAYVFVARPTLLSGHDEAPPAAAFSTKNSEPDKHWVCPMHPEISQDHPGTCPICGMKLVESGAHQDHEHGVHVDNATVQRLGVRLARVKQALIGQEIPTYGNVDVAENKSYAVHPKYEGWIKKLYVHAVGESVKAGQVLYEIYSPELITRERTYLSSIERRKQLLQSLQTSPDTENDYVMELTMDAAKDRARLHQEEGVSVENIKLIEESKQAGEVVQIVAERSGVVSQITAREGSFVAQANPILVLTDIASVWVDVALYPDQVAQVRNGDAIIIKDAAGHEIRSRLSLINPIAGNNKVTARAEIDNSRHELRPGTFVDVSIQIHPHRALVLPRTAVMYTGRGNMVMLSRGDGHFLPAGVETGVESGDEIEILDGLQEGAEVAVNGQFLLDSAAAVGATAERMHTN